MRLAPIKRTLTLVDRTLTLTASIQKGDTMLSKHLLTVPFVVLCAACTNGGGGAGAPMDMASDPAVTDPSMAPMFEVDPFWPKPLPNHLLLGSTIGGAVDSR